jgi:hypothetical protein
MWVEPATLRTPAIFPQMDNGRRRFVFAYEEYPPGGYLDRLDGLGSGAHDNSSGQHSR